MTGKPSFWMRAVGLAAVVGVGLVLQNGIARADSSLQLNPLRYDDVLSGTNVKNGYIDVSNPSDTTVTVKTSVQGFKQADLDGNLAFFDDPTLQAGIIPTLDSFLMGPRESVRVVFSVNPAKLPQGGVYAAIFFTVVPPVGSASTTFVNETANVGTLLILQNGGGVQSGQLMALSGPLVQFGQGLVLTVTYRNTGPAGGGLAFTPKLTAQVVPFGTAQSTTTSFVMPGASRSFGVSRAGSYFGLLPIRISDDTGKSSKVIWVIACTGWYQGAVLIFTLALMIYGAFILKNQPFTHRAAAHMKDRKRRSNRA